MKWIWLALKQNTIAWQREVGSTIIFKPHKKILCLYRLYNCIEIPERVNLSRFEHSITIDEVKLSDVSKFIKELLSRLDSFWGNISLIGSFTILRNSNDILGNNMIGPS